MYHAAGTAVLAAALGVHSLLLSSYCVCVLMLLCMCPHTLGVHSQLQHLNLSFNNATWVGLAAVGHALAHWGAGALNLLALPGFTSTKVQILTQKAAQRIAWKRQQTI